MKRAAALAVAICGLAAPSAAALATTRPVATDPNALVQPSTSSRPPGPGWRLSADRATAIASALSRVRGTRRGQSGSYPVTFEKGFGRWQVSFFSRASRHRPAREIAQVYVRDADGRVTEVWTGFQVAWTMARGYPGAFGHKSNSLWLWLVLSVLFLAPFVNRRRLRSLRHLDLLVVLSLSVSFAFFNHADLGLSVPLSYPPLLYLLARMLWLARPGARREPLVLSVPVTWLAVAVVFLMGFRIGLNVTDSNVIDVGYAGVVGADRLVHGERVYGAFPKNIEHGDTYGPFAYEAYVPPLEVAGFRGRWDDLPAAHLASVLFDLLCLGGLWLLGRHVRGPTLGTVLAYAWAACPFTLLALSSDSNDALVGAAVLGALLATARPGTRGVMAALAGATKFAPLALAPVLAAGTRERPARPARFVIAYAAAMALVALPFLLGGGLDGIVDRTVTYQANRSAPFSIWGLWGGLGWEQTAVQVAALALGVAAPFLPRRPGVTPLAAVCAAILLAVQLGTTYWFYLYVAWFLGPVLLVLLDGGGDRHHDLLDRRGAATGVGGDAYAHEPGVVL